MKIRYLLLAVAAATLSAPAQAWEQGDWLFRAGVWNVAPKSDNGDTVDVDDGYALGFNGTYMFTENFGVEVLAATPFSHDVRLKADGSEVAEVKHLPPTVSMQYHFPISDAASFYAGAGVNWTVFFDEDTKGALDGTDLELDDSLGLALQIGADIDLNGNWFLNLDVRYIDIESDADLDGSALTTVEIDPWVIGLNVGWRP